MSNDIFIVFYNVTRSVLLCDADSNVMYLIMYMFMYVVYAMLALVRARGH